MDCSLDFSCVCQVLVSSAKLESMIKERFVLFKSQKYTWLLVEAHPILEFLRY